MPEGETSLMFEHPSRRVRRRELRAFLVELAGELGAVTCLITTDERLRAMNREFHGKDYSTDVLSFPTHVGRTPRSAADALVRLGGFAKRPTRGSAADQGVRPTALGEIAISLDRALEQAAALGHTVEEELRILILHGMLHLAGLDHETDGGQMARVEARWRKRLGLPAGLIERTRVPA